MLIGVPNLLSVASLSDFIRPENAWSRGAPSFSPGLHYTGQAFKRRNVVRFKNKGAKEDLPDRRHVIRELLCNQMGFTPADILAVINLPDRQGYDISFKLMASLDRFWASVTKFRGTEGWDQFILIPVSKPGTVSVNILFWNESVPPQDIVIWLRRHCDMVSDLTKCLDDDGIWTGGWRVLVKLRQHSNVTLHLPNSFFIGRERGVCFYAGQPRLCFKCGKAGHVAGVCTVVKCNLCGEIGHTSAMCTNVRCNLCVLADHCFIQNVRRKASPLATSRTKLFIAGTMYLKTSIAKEFKQSAVERKPPCHKCLFICFIQTLPAVAAMEVAQAGRMADPTLENACLASWSNLLSIRSLKGVLKAQSRDNGEPSQTPHRFVYLRWRRTNLVSLLKWTKTLVITQGLSFH
ncbi:uncharacterized protein PAF06_000795 [Gastrophryne carolinensis]